MGFIDDCAERVYSEYKVYAGIPPLCTIKPGDYGRLDGRKFRREGSLHTLKHSLATKLSIIDSPTVSDVEWKSSGTRTSRFSAGANFGNSSGPHANAGFHVQFEREHEFFYFVPGLRFRELENMYDLGDELMRRSLLDRHHPEFWPWYDELCVVTGVYAAPAMTLALSRSAKSEVTFEAEGVLQSSALERTTVALSATSADSASQRFAGKITGSDTNQYYTPFVELRKVHWNIFGARWWAVP